MAGERTRPGRSSILDKAREWGRLYFVMDGCALVSKTLRVHSNTTIFCPDKSCGFFLAEGSLAEGSDCSVISNADWSSIYSPGQVHHREGENGNIVFDNVIVRRTPCPKKPSGSLFRISGGSSISEVLEGNVSIPYLKKIVEIEK